MLTDNTPILVASAQQVLREIATPDEVKSPQQLSADVAKQALSGVEALAASVDTLAHTRTFIDSAAALEHPFGNTSKMPLSVANLAGISPSRLVYADVGGQSPQRLVNEFAESIYKGESQCVLICSSETTGAMKQALRAGWQLDWQDDPEGDIEDRGFKELWDEVELRHHITYPPQVYALFENAWRHLHGLSIDEHRLLMGKLFARFSEIAAANPYSQFPVAHSAEFLATASKQNYAFNEPYNKWMIAQDAVNQAAAIVLTSVGKARELNIPESQWVYLHGYGDADDTFVSQRAELHSSIAIKAAADTALAMANKRIDDIALIDIYSCFPIAVLAGCDALGISWDSRDLTVTGGLPFFGGPGNGYSLHSIAEMHQQLQADPGTFGLVSANGGYLSKESVGVYSTTPVQNWTPCEPDVAQAIVDKHPTQAVAYPYNGDAIIESYSLVYKKGLPAIGFCLCREPANDKRVMAKAVRGDDATLQAMLAEEPIGRRVIIETGERGATFTFA